MKSYQVKSNYEKKNTAGKRSPLTLQNRKQNGGLT